MALVVTPHISTNMTTWKKRDGIVVVLIQVALLVLFGIFARYDDKGLDTLASYPMFQDVHVMIFIGFGFLMTFLKRYGFSSVGYNFLLAALIVQWVLIMEGFFEMEEGKIKINLMSLLSADVGAAAVLISMGAVLGRTSYIQLIVMGVMEIVLFVVNSHIGIHVLQAADAGDSIFVHAFGAYFGLAVSFMVNRKKKGIYEEHAMEGSSYNSDLFAMIGTVFLWMFWPSFNAATSSGEEQHRALINTYLALTSCCVTSYVTSIAISPGHKFDMVHVQNSTLAGGVAVGAAANLMLEPYGALIVGVAAGVLSVVGYHAITPWIDGKLHIHDTCGVHNLHGMPALLAAIISAIMAAITTLETYDDHLKDVFPAMVSNKNESGFTIAGRTGMEQAGFQLAALGVTLAIAIVGGLITGFILSTTSSILFSDVNVDNMYTDDICWIIHEGHGHAPSNGNNDHELRIHTISGPTNNVSPTVFSGGIENPDFQLGSESQIAVHQQNIK